MTTKTGAGNGRVINRHCGPIIGAVAVITSIAAGDMVARLARCGGPVVTAGAAASDGSMIDIGVGPVTGDMAIITGIERGNVGR